MSSLRERSRDAAELSKRPALLAYVAVRTASASQRLRAPAHRYPPHGTAAGRAAIRHYSISTRRRALAQLDARMTK